MYVFIYIIYIYIYNIFLKSTYYNSQDCYFDSSIIFSIISSSVFLLIVFSIIFKSQQQMDFEQIS